MAANKKTADYGAHGVYNSGGITLADGDSADAQFDATGAMRVVGSTEAGAAGLTEVAVASGNVANAAAVAAMPAVPAKTNYISGFILTAGGATAGSLVTATVAGILGGTLSFTFAVPAGATLGATPLVVDFARPIPASAVNTAITVTLPALGAGNTNAAAVVHGFVK